MGHICTYHVGGKSLSKGSRKVPDLHSQHVVDLDGVTVILQHAY